MKASFVFAFHSTVDLLVIAVRLFLEDGGQCGAGVFRIDINTAAEHCLMGNVGAGQIETTLDWEMGAVSDLLGDELAENKLFGKVLRANHDAVAPPLSAGDEQDYEKKGK